MQSLRSAKYSFFVFFYVCSGKYKDYGLMYRKMRLQNKLKNSVLQPQILVAAVRF